MVRNAMGRSLAAAVLAVAAVASGQPKPDEADMAAMEEYWRQAPSHGCLCCTVFNPAPKAAAVPRDIGSLPVLDARVYENRPRLTCCCAGEGLLWAADDLAVHQIDAARRSPVRTYTTADGLSDTPARQLLAAGRWLWIVGRGRLSRLDVAGGKIDVPDQPSFTVARMAAGPAGTFLITESGAWRWDEAGGKFLPLGAYPGQPAAAKAVQRGFWRHEWQIHWAGVLRGAAVGDQALYVLAGNVLSRHDAGGGWRQLAGNAWRIELAGAVLWALVTDGVLRCDDATGKTTAYTGAAAPAPGMGLDLAAGGPAPALLAAPRFDKQANQFRDGGICLFDSHAGRWSALARVGDVDVSFPTALAQADGRTFVAVQLAGAVEHRSLHPGMASVKRHLPRIDALAVAVLPPSGDGQALRLKGIDGQDRWIMGQRKKHGQDRVRPQKIERLLPCGGRLWAVLQNFPEKWYGGYYPTLQCVARATADGWQALADRPRRESVGLAGEYPNVLCLTATHGEPVVLGYGYPQVLGLVRCGESVWLVHEHGVYGYDASADRFTPALTCGYRACWQVTAGAADANSVWFGSDAGTISRYDRAGGRLELLAAAAGREIVELRAAGGKLWVRTKPTQAVLPPSLSGLARLPAGESLAWDGRDWSASSSPPPPAAGGPDVEVEGGKAGNYLLRRDPAGEKGVRAGFLEGVFQPKVLCAEPGAGGEVWLKVWGGVARVSTGGPSAPTGSGS